MSDIIDKLVEGAGQVISEVDKGGQISSAVTGLRQRLAETERRRRVNLIKQEIRDLQTQEAQTINALSAQVLALHEGHVYMERRPPTGIWGGLWSFPEIEPDRIDEWSADRIAFDKSDVEPMETLRHSFSHSCRGHCCCCGGRRPR